MPLRGKAAVLDRPNGTFTVEELDVPDPLPNGILVRQELCGICATDAYMYRGHLPGLTFPLVLGHETVGIVEKLGANVSEDSSGRPLAVGDRVYVVPGLSCGRCIFCAVHHEPTLCVQGSGYGFRPQPAEPPHFQGGYAQYLNLVEGSTFLKMEAPAEAAVALEPFSIGINQISRIKMNPGATVVVQGAGAIGILTLAAAKEAGALKTILIGAPQARLELAKEFGADVTINIEEVPDPDERVRMVKAETLGGYGADVVFECSGVLAAIPEGLNMLRRGGTYVEPGHFTDHGDVSINPFQHIVNKQSLIVGVWGSSTPHFVFGRAIIEAGKYPFADLVSHKLPLERVADGIEAIGKTYRLDGEEIRKVAIAANT